MHGGKGCGFESHLCQFFCHLDYFYLYRRSGPSSHFLHDWNFHKKLALRAHCGIPQSLETGYGEYQDGAARVVISISSAIPFRSSFFFSSALASPQSFSVEGSLLLCAHLQEFRGYQERLQMLHRFINLITMPTYRIPKAGYPC